MNIQNADAFKAMVENIFLYRGIPHRDVRKGDRKNPILSQQLFFNLSRKGGHKPDLIITIENLPCELKSPKEIYELCRYSNSHFYSYILQTIFGQCFSFADLYRPNENQTSVAPIYLILPKIVKAEVQGFKDIEGFFNNILSSNWHPFLELMQIESISFSSPSFCSHNNNRYGLIDSDINILCTKIEYQGGSLGSNLNIDI
jgi:hypothetical protein